MTRKNFAKKNTSSQGPVLGMQHTFDRLKRTKRGKGRYYCCALGFPALLGPVAVVPTQSKMKALEIQSRCDCNQWFQICRTPAHLKLMASCYDLGYCHTKDCNMTADVPVRTSHLFWVHDHIPQISCSLLAQTSAPWTSSGGIATACHERSCESLWIWVFLAVRCLHFRDGWCLKCHAVMQWCRKREKQPQKSPRDWGPEALTVASRGTMRGASSSASAWNLASAHIFTAYRHIPVGWCHDFGFRFQLHHPRSHATWAANHESGTPTAAIQMQLGSLQRKIWWCSWRVSSRWWSLFTLNHEAKIK